MNKRKWLEGGEPNVAPITSIAWETDALRDALNIVKSLYELNGVAISGGFIISGCITTYSSTPIDDSTVATITPGYIYYQGEILKVDAHSVLSPHGTPLGFRFYKDTTYDTRGDKIFLDGTYKRTMEISRGKIISYDTEFTGIMTVSAPRALSHLLTIANLNLVTDNIKSKEFVISNIGIGAGAEINLSTLGISISQVVGADYRYNIGTFVYINSGDIEMVHDGSDFEVKNETGSEISSVKIQIRYK